MIKWLPLTSLLGLAQNDGQCERVAMLSNFIENLETNASCCSVVRSDSR